MEFGMPFLMETDTLEECARLCSQLGLGFIELNMNFPQCQLPELSADRLRRIMDQEHLYFTIHLDENLNVCDFNPKVRQAYLETAVETIELAKAIGAPVINMHLAKGIYLTLPGRKEYLFKRYEEEYRRHIAEFGEMCRDAVGDAAIHMAVENTEGFMVHERKALELLLQQPCFGLTLDIGHSHAAGNVDIPFYLAYEDRLIHMHGHDAKGKSYHLAFGDGEIDLEERLLMAEKAGARVVLETKTIEALTKTVSWLRK